MTTRDDILKKYGVTGSATPTTKTVTPSKEVSSTSSLREQALAKYNKPEVKVETPVVKVETKPVTKIEEIKQKKEVLTKAPEETTLQKVGSFFKKGLQAAGILQSDKEILARSQAADSLTTALNAKPYIEIGKQLGLDKTMKVDLPPGADESVRPYYTDIQLAKTVKDNIENLKTQFGIEAPEQIDAKFVKDNFNAITKELGIRDMPTNVEFLGIALTGALGVGGAAAVGLGAKLLPTLGKIGAGVLGFEAINKVERELNKVIFKEDKSLAEIATDKLQLGDTGAGLVSLLDLFVKGKALHGVYQKSGPLAEKLTKDIITTYKMPKTVFVDAAKVKNIFQTGTEISPEELSLVTSLGLDSKGYKSAIQNGVTIEIPAEKLVTLTDKPYWAKLKNLIGMKSTSEVLSKTDGKPTQTVRGYLEGKSGKPITAPYIEETRTNAVLPENKPGSPVLGLSEPVKTALTSPISSKLIETIQKFTPEDSLAFGKKIIEKLDEKLGTGITPEQAQGIPEGIKVNEIGSPDGRPAQFTNGKIEIFLPDMVKDIQALAQGKRILAHGGANAKVYEMKPGESMEELSVRYVRDVLVHELAHQKTVDLTDDTRMKQLRQDVLQAQASKNQNQITIAKTAVEKFMESLEEKANNYERSNREGLETEIFGKPGRKSSLQKTITEKVSGAPAEKKVISEKKLLTDKLKAEEKASKEGYVAGEKKGYSTAKEKISNKNETISSRKEVLIDYATTFLPFRSRGKFLKAINNVISEKEMSDVLNRMFKESDTVERKTLMSEINKEIASTKVTTKGKVPNAKFEYEAQKKLNRIRALQKGFETEAKSLRDAGNKEATAYELAQNEIANKISNWQTQNPDSLIPGEILAEIQELKMVGIKDMTASELRSVLSDIQSIKETGRTLKEIERFNRDTEIQRIRDGVTKVITGNGAKNPNAKVGLRRPEDKPTAFENIGNFFTLKHAGFEEILDALSKFDKGSKPYESFLSEHFTKGVRDSFVKQNEGEFSNIEKIGEIINENYKFKSKSEMYDYLNSMKKPVTLNDVTMADGSLKDIKITKGEALQMYMWGKDETLAGTFAEGMNWGPEAISKIEGLLTTEDKAMGDKMLDFYREYYKGINDVYSKEYGVDLPFNENYSPISRNVETSIPENVLLAQEMKQYASVKNRSLKSRVKNNLELKPKDAFSNLTSHINMMEHYKAWSQTMYELRRTFSDKQLRRDIEDYHGKAYLKEIDNFMNDFARDGVDRSKTIEWLDKLRTNTTAAILGLNPNVALKQLTGTANYWIELPTDKLFTGVAGFWGNPLAKSKFLYDNSPVLQERFGKGYERDIKAALQTKDAKILAGKTNSLREKMFTFIRQSDKLTVYQGAWASYRYKYMELKKEGKSDAEAKDGAIRFAEDVTNRVQESSQLSTLSSIQRGGSLYKALTMFQSQPSKYVRILWNIARNWKYGRGSKATHIKRLLVLWLVVPTIYNAVAEQLKDEKYRATPGEFAGKVALGPLSYPLMVGQVFQSLFEKATGSNFDYKVSPAVSVFDDMMKATENLTAGDIDEALTYLADVGGKLKGVPTTLITKPIRKGLKDDEGGRGVKASF